MAGGAAALAAPKSAKRRNVLFIAADDLNHALSAYGNPLMRTPHMDAIASAGVRFDRAYCQYPLCNPSRASLLTGLAPDTTGVYDLTVRFRDKLSEHPTLPQAFRREGYFTARAGKIFHANVPSDVGKDALDDVGSWTERFNPAGVDRLREGQLATNYLPKRPIGSSICFYASPAPEEDHTDAKVAATIADLTRKRQDDAWFLAAGFYRPHAPWIAPTKYFDMVPIRKLKLIPFQDAEISIAPKWAYWTQPANWDLTEKQRLEGMQAYLASVLFLDAQVGKLLDSLRRTGQHERTTIVLWSDHGYGLGQHGQWMKQTVFEHSARTPLLIAGAGVRAKGKGCARTVELLDIYPTLTGLCGCHVHRGFTAARSALCSTVLPRLGTTRPSARFIASKPTCAVTPSARSVIATPCGMTGRKARNCTTTPATRVN